MGGSPTVQRGKAVAVECKGGRIVDNIERKDEGDRIQGGAERLNRGQYREERLGVYVSRGGQRGAIADNTNRWLNRGLK